MTAIIKDSMEFFLPTHFLPFPLLTTLVSSRPLFSALAPWLMPELIITSDEDDVSRGVGALMLQYAPSTVFAQAAVIGNCQPDTEFLETLFSNGLPWLKRLRFSYSCDLVEVSLEPVGNLRMLTDLAITWTPHLFGHHFIQLVSCGAAARLRSLELEHARALKDAPMVHFFENAPSLQSVTLRNCDNLTGASLVALCGGPAAQRELMRTLEISSQSHAAQLGMLDVSTSLAPAFALIKDKLYSLNISTSQSEVDGDGACAVIASSFPNSLHRLTLAARNVTRAGWQSVGDALLELRFLRAEALGGMHDEHVAGIAKLVAVEQLELGYSRDLTDAGLMTLVHEGTTKLLRSLRVTRGDGMDGSCFKSEGDAVSSSWPVLERLDLHIVSAEDLSDFLRNVSCGLKSSLRHLSLYGSCFQLKDADVEHLLRFRKLEVLSLHGAEALSESVVQKLWGVKSLWSLYVGAA